LGWTYEKMAIQESTPRGGKFFFLVQPPLETMLQPIVARALQVEEFAVARVL